MDMDHWARVTVGGRRVGPGPKMLWQEEQRREQAEDGAG